MRRFWKKKENSNAEFIGLLRQERASLLELESDYKVSFKNYRLFDHVVRNFEIDAELIRRTRNAAKLTQEGLSEDNLCAGNIGKNRKRKSETTKRKSTSDDGEDGKEWG